MVHSRHSKADFWLYVGLAKRNRFGYNALRDKIDVVLTLMDKLNKEEEAH